jgi:hypothetical protein
MSEPEPYLTTLCRRGWHYVEPDHPYQCGGPIIAPVVPPRVRGCECHCHAAQIAALNDQLAATT